MDPTSDPAKDPTFDPTFDPTKDPTMVPTNPADPNCDNGNIHFVGIVDRICVPKPPICDSVGIWGWSGTGGATSCSFSSIASSGRVCELYSAPCIMPQPARSHPAN